MTTATDHATLRPPEGARGQRAAARRSRLVFTAGQVRAQAIDGAADGSVHQVAALVDDPVRLAGDDKETEAGTLGIRFADGTAAYLRLADWSQPWSTPKECRSTKRALAQRLGVQLEKPGADGPRPAPWRPTGVTGVSGTRIARLGNIVPGLLVVATLVAIPVASWSGAERQTVQSMARTLLLVAAGWSLLLVVLLWARWLLRRAREGSVQPDQVLRPRPKDTVDLRFLRTARLLGVGDEICVRGGFGEELWLGGPRDDFGVRTAEIGPGFRWEEPHRKAVSLLDGSRRALASLDLDDWFGTTEAVAELVTFCSAVGVDAHDLEPRGRNRPADNLYGYMRHAAPRWLWSAGLAYTEMLSMVGVAVLIGLGGVEFDMPVVAAVAAVPVVLLVVPALVRTATHHLWLKKPAAR